MNEDADLPSSEYLRCRCVALLDVLLVRLGYPPRAGVARLAAARGTRPKGWVAILNANRP